MQSSSIKVTGVHYIPIHAISNRPVIINIIIIIINIIVIAVVPFASTFSHSSLCFLLLISLSQRKLKQKRKNALVSVYIYIYVCIYIYVHYISPISFLLTVFPPASPLAYLKYILRRKDYFVALLKSQFVSHPRARFFKPSSPLNCVS